MVGLWTLFVARFMTGQEFARRYSCRDVRFGVRGATIQNRGVFCQRRFFIGRNVLDVEPAWGPRKRWTFAGVVLESTLPEKGPFAK